MKEIKRGIGLARVSTTAQANVQHGSLEQQTEMMKRFVDSLNDKDKKTHHQLEIITTDVSGTKKTFDRRPDILKLRNAIKNRSIDFIVIEKLDRLARFQIGARQLVEEAHAAGILIYETQSGTSINLKDRNSRMTFNMSNWNAEEYSLDLQEKIPRKQREARVNNQKDTNTVAPLGLDPHPTKVGKYVRNESEMAVVIDIMSKFCEFASYVNTAEYCKKMDYRTKVRFTKQKTDREGNIIPPRKVGGELFNPKRLNLMLTNSKYRGRAFFKDDWNQFPKLQDKFGMVPWNYEHGRLVPQELLDRVDATMKKVQVTRQRKAKDGRVYLLSGTLKTADGSLFQGCASNSGKNIYYYSKEAKKRINKEGIERIVCARVSKYLSESGTLSQAISTVLKHNRVGLPLIDEEIKKVQREIAVHQKVLEGFSGVLREAALQGSANLTQVCATLVEERTSTQAMIERSERKLTGLHRKREDVQRSLEGHTLESYLRRVLENFDRKTDQQKKRVVQAIVPEVIVHPDNRLELKVNPDPERITTTPAGPAGCHTGGKIMGLKGNWRGGRDSNPRPSA